LALRFAQAGEDIIIGSRQSERAAHAAETLRARLTSGPARRVDGFENGVAAREADIVALAPPFEGLEALLHQIAPSLAGKIVLDVVNPLHLGGGIFTLIPVPAGSAAELTQKLVPQAQVVSGFKNLSAKELWELEGPLHGDVLLCSDAPQATRYFVELIRRIPDLRPVDAGRLANARRLESITALLLNLNRRYHAITSVQILGLKI